MATNIYALKGALLQCIVDSVTQAKFMVDGDDTLYTATVSGQVEGERAVLAITFDLSAATDNLLAVRNIQLLGGAGSTSLMAVRDVSLDIDTTGVETFTYNWLFDLNRFEALPTDNTKYIISN